MKRMLLALLLAVLTLLAATGIALGAIHITGFPYNVDIDYLNISENTGLPREEILENYTAVMKYLSPFQHTKFDLPTLKYSESGAQHFADCKVLFIGVYIAAFASIVVAAVLFWKKQIDWTSLKYSGLFTLLVPALLGFAIWIDFDRVFVLFHSLFFDGKTWIFDQAVDEIIKILPSDFFMHCALFIAAFWVIAGLTEIIVGLRHTKRRRAI